MRTAHRGVAEPDGSGVVFLPDVGAHSAGHVDGAGIDMGHVRRRHRTFFQLCSAVGPLRRKTPIRSFSAVALLDCLMARVSLWGIPDFLLRDRRGDLSDMALPGCGGVVARTPLDRAMTPTLSDRHSACGGGRVPADPAYGSSPIQPVPTSPL
jgi:hypothetical protein